MFTPVNTSLGALLLFSSSFGLLIHNGEVFGISSVLSSSIFRPSLKTLSIVAGLISSLGTVYLVTPSLRPTYPDAPSSWTSAASTLGLGLLIGWGTKVTELPPVRREGNTTHKQYRMARAAPPAICSVACLASHHDH